MKLEDELKTKEFTRKELWESRILEINEKAFELSKKQQQTEYERKKDWTEFEANLKKKFENDEFEKINNKLSDIENIVKDIKGNIVTIK